MTFTLSSVQEADHADWLDLSRAFLAGYPTAVDEADFKDTFQRLLRSSQSVESQRPTDICGLILRDEAGQAQAIAHYFFHKNTFTRKPQCQFSDLYVRPECRGKGYGKALIRAVEQKSIEAGCLNMYWTTAFDNTAARRLYDSITPVDRVVYKIRH